MEKTCSHEEVYVQRVIDFDKQRVYEALTCHFCHAELDEVVTGEDLSEEWELLRKYSPIQVMEG